MIFQSSPLRPASRTLLCLGAGALLAPLVVAFGIDPLRNELTLNDRRDAALSIVVDLGRLEGRIRLRVGGRAGS